MKPTLLLAMLSMALALPGTAATYTVKPGDGLEKIARKSGCSPAALAKANGLKLSSIIHPGQKLKLPDAPGTQKTHASSSAPAALAGKTHTIRPGDTYYKIAREYGVTVESLTAANPNIKANALRPGKVIRLSAAKPTPEVAPQPVIAATPKPQAPPAPPAETAPPAEAPEVTAATTPDPAQPAPPASTPPKETSSPSPVRKIRSVTIEDEMTYAEFAAKHGTDIGRLNDLNGLDLTNATVLAKGSELYVPAQP